MSMMQSRTSSMAPAFETSEPRISEMLDVVPDKIGPAPYRSGDEPANNVRAIHGEMAFPRETASAHHESVQDLRKAVDTAPRQSRSVAPVPRITIHAFCESHDAISVLERSATDRIMSRAKME